MAMTKCDRQSGSHNLWRLPLKTVQSGRSDKEVVVDKDLITGNKKF